LSMRANWIDSVDPRNLGFLNGFAEELNDLLDHSKELIELHNGSDILQLRKVVSLLDNSKRIMMELDNNGELPVDLLLVEYLLSQGKKVFLVCKNKPVLNDVLPLDVKNVVAGSQYNECLRALKDGRLSIIHSNSQIPGKYWPTLSQEYQDVFSKADLLIVKGQGNFQSMPFGYTHKGKFNYYNYKIPVVYLGVIKSSITYQGFKMLPHFRDRVQKDIGYILSLSD